MPESWREPTREPQQIETWRCARCGRIVAKIRLGAGSFVEVKCGSCNSYNSKTIASDR